MRVSVVATGIAAMAAQQPAPNYLSLDMNRSIQDRPAGAQPPGRAAGRPCRLAGRCHGSACSGDAGRAGCAAGPPVAAPAPVAAAPVAPIVASMPTPAPVYEAPVEAPVMVAPRSRGRACRPGARSGSGARRRRTDPRPGACPGSAAAPAGRRERLAGQAVLRRRRLRFGPSRHPPDGRPPGDRQSRAEPVPAHHGCLLGAESPPRPRERPRPSRSLPARRRPRTSLPWPRRLRFHARRRSRLRSASMSRSVRSPRATTTICRFRLSCGAKRTDAGKFLFSTHLRRGPAAPLFFDGA